MEGAADNERWVEPLRDFAPAWRMLYDGLRNEAGLQDLRPDLNLFRNLIQRLLHYPLNPTSSRMLVNAYRCFYGLSVLSGRPIDEIQRAYQSVYRGLYRRGDFSDWSELELARLTAKDKSSVRSIAREIVSGFPKSAAPSIGPGD